MNEINKEYLSRPFKLSRAIRNKERILSALKSAVPYSTPVNGEEKTGSTNEVHSVVESTALRIVSLEEELAKDRRTLAELLAETERVINCIPNTSYRTVLYLRYVCMLSWDDVSVKLGYAPGSNGVHYLHRQALDSFRLE